MQGQYSKEIWRASTSCHLPRFQIENFLSKSYLSFDCTRWHDQRKIKKKNPKKQVDGRQTSMYNKIWSRKFFLKMVVQEIRGGWGGTVESSVAQPTWTEKCKTFLKKRQVQCYTSVKIHSTGDTNWQIHIFSQGKEVQCS